MLKYKQTKTTRQPNKQNTQKKPQNTTNQDPPKNNQTKKSESKSLFLHMMCLPYSSYRRKPGNQGSAVQVLEL